MASRHEEGPTAIRHRGYGKFAVDGEVIKPKSRMW